ncbi:hypothetical protein B0H16DRAFT_1855494 [Mycena metata]|uniref:Uncharacterized protein n=1 Tax=Mycena metata TaxID=1033252 RepID=A0AAD7DJ84_9AGAR|nr:hypothetical protein B0H16DRAFT_1855494 [Mycena metata]
MAEQLIELVKSLKSMGPERPGTLKRLQGITDLNFSVLLSFQGQQLTAHTNLLLCSLIPNPALIEVNVVQFISMGVNIIIQAFNVPKSFDASFNSFNIDPNHDTRPLLPPPLQFIQPRYFIQLTDLPLFEHTFIKSTLKLSRFGSMVSDTFTL